MKLCAACSQELPRNKFSKKQWQLKKCRRCKECVADNREAVTSRDVGPGALDAVNDKGASDEDLFKEPPPNKDCPICMLPMPLVASERTYQECCGKTICNGCTYAVSKEYDRCRCPFCRAPEVTSNREIIERFNHRVEADDAIAMNVLGYYYKHGNFGLRQDHEKANELFLQAGELGCATAYDNIATVYLRGHGMDQDMKKAKYYYELAAVQGSVGARYNLGVFEKRAGDMNRAVKHYMISASAGDDDSLKTIRECFLNGNATKDDFEKALRAHKDATDAMKSEQREAYVAALMKRKDARRQAANWLQRHGDIK